MGACAGVCVCVCRCVCACVYVRVCRGCMLECNGVCVVQCVPAVNAELISGLTLSPGNHLWYVMHCETSYPS